MLLKGLPSTLRDESMKMLVIDIGYSKSSKSCGLKTALQCISLTFGDAIKETAKQINDNACSLLVIEAPLSMFHNKSGNPEIRGEFEKGRAWYHGAGASTLLAAQRFIQQLQAFIPDDRELYLAEAFLSFKEQATSHVDDASEIFTRFWSTTPEIMTAECEPIIAEVEGIPSVRTFLA